MEMSKNAFFDALSTDTRLQQAAANSPDAESLRQLAVKRGFDVSLDEIRAAIGEDLAIESLEVKSLGWGVAYLSFSSQS